MSYGPNEHTGLGHHQDLHDAAVELSKAVANLISINQTLRDALGAADNEKARLRDEIERLRANSESKWREEAYRAQARAQELEGGIEARDAINIQWRNRVQELEDKLKRFQVNWDKLCEMHEAEQARVQELEAKQYEGRIDRIPRVKELEKENERLRGIVYRITAPTASQVEEDDRAAAFDEGRELTDPNAARTARWKARYPSDS